MSKRDTLGRTLLAFSVGLVGVSYLFHLLNHPDTTPRDIEYESLYVPPPPTPDEAAREEMLLTKHATCLAHMADLSVTCAEDPSVATCSMWVTAIKSCKYWDLKERAKWAK